MATVKAALWELTLGLLAWSIADTVSAEDIKTSIWQEESRTTFKLQPVMAYAHDPSLLAL